MSNFAALSAQWGLSDELQKAIAKVGYDTPTPVQEKVIPALLEKDGDVVVLAKTGTGKTAAFGLPLLQKIETGGGTQALILCPTRELAAQVAKSLVGLGTLKGIRVASILGGESYRRQFESLRQRPEIIVSTPGRLVDLIEQGKVDLSEARFLILDEADEMLSFGFQDSLERIREELSGGNLQTWLFSATMSPSVQNLSRKILDEPRNFMISNGSEAALRLESFAAVVFEEDKEKALQLLLKKEPDFYGIIFAQTKKQVADLEIALRPLGMGVESLHGDKPQVERHRVLDRIRNRQSRILVATDVAARGLDIQDLTHVVNFEIPWDIETYTHRIGRTARAGKAGIVWTLVRPKEAPKLARFERALKFKFQNLKIPSQREVVSMELQTKLKGLLSQNISDTEESVRFYDKILGSFAHDQQIEIGEDARQWLLRFLNGTGLYRKILDQEPRAFELRERSESSGDRRSSGGGPRGGYSGDRRRSSSGGESRGFSGGSRSPRSRGFSELKDQDSKGEGRRSSGPSGPRRATGGPSADHPGVRRGLPSKRRERQERW